MTESEERAKALTIRQHLEKITARHRGRLTPEAVVADAKSPSSPLHNEFEWDLKKAAHAHWIEQARTLIRSVRVEIQITDRVIESVAYVRDPNAGSDEQGYVPVKDLRSDKVSAKQALRYEFGRAEAVLLRARELAVVLGLANDVDRVIGSVRSIAKKAA